MSTKSHGIVLRTYRLFSNIFFFVIQSSLPNLKFGPLNIKDEPVNSGMAYCSQQCIQGDTLHRMKDVMHSVQIKRFRNNVSVPDA